MAQILGIDVGTKTLGLAVSDQGATVAMPLRTLQRRGMKRDLAAIREVVEDRGIQEVVVGLPLNLDGSPGAMAEECNIVSEKLSQDLGLTVQRWDERLSTVAAERVLLEADVSRKKRKQVVDKLAATIILQGFLDHRLLGLPPVPEGGQTR